jgi:hypothetical protein
MLARVIHFGPDHCHRLMVLRSAGYAVEECHSLSQLGERLESGEAPDAVLMSDDGEFPLQEPMAVSRKHSSTPVILFRSTTVAYEDSGFDLVIPCLTPPKLWLSDVDAVIEKNRAALRR